MGNLAATYRYQGRWKEAEELGVQVMEIQDRVLGPEHPDTLTSMGNVAYTFYSKNNIHHAIALMNKCVRLREGRLGLSHPHTIDSARFLRQWKATVDSQTNKHQSPVQAENDQLLGDIAQDISYPRVVIIDADRNGEPRQGPVRSATPLRAFIESHPLLLTSRGGSLMMREHDFHEVD
ncbi:hypothetical protein BDW60DRAFT_201889 [Aspergillus nidulans var. acristatus]